LGADPGRLPLLVALPPSEGKAAGGDGPPLDLASLAHADVLTRPREQVLAALVKLCTADGVRGSNRARKVLGLSEGLTGEIAVDAAVRDSPTLPAAERYTGVLYDHLALGSLPAPARARAEASVRIVSGLWGVLRPGDAIPAYRLSVGVTLPKVGRLTAHWRAPLAGALDAPALVVDCRSADYQQAWRPGAGSTVVLVRAFTVAPDGTRKVVSHMAKATRGDVARALLVRADGARRDAGTPEEVARVVAATGLTCELVPPAKAGGPWALDVLLDA
jgi:cytoplasmic iron level regulating protein YaaA (DUF328/UPF0246 family)